MRLIIPILIVLNLLPVTAFPYKTPLSKFSSQWDDPYFNKANTTAYDYFLKENEKQFIHIINLGRLSPTLFAQTVLVPFCDKNGYTGPVYGFLSKLNAHGQLNMLSAQIYYKWLAKELSKTNNETENYKDALAATKLKMQPIVQVSKSATAIDIILTLLLDEGNNGSLFREMFLGDYTDAGIFISQDSSKGFSTKLLFDKLTEKDREELPKLYSLNLETFEKYQMITLNEHPGDSVLTFFTQEKFPEYIAKTYPNTDFRIIKDKSIFASREFLEKVNDSLKRNGISRSYQLVSFNINLKQKYTTSSKNKAKPYYDYQISSSSTQSVDDECEQALDYYYVGRSINPSNNSSEMEIVRLKTDAPQPAFAADSIGVFIDSISFQPINNYINSLPNCEPVKLAALITKPWKTELEKVRAIFLWINKNIKYDFEGLSAGKPKVEVADVLKYRAGVCDGYARLFYYLCTGAGIRSKYILGTTSRGPHAWNAVCIDNKWYLIDATWGNKYFLMKPELFIQDHYPSVKKWALFTRLITKKEWDQHFKKVVNN